MSSSSTNTTTDGALPAPDIHLQVNGTGAWRTLSRGGINDMELFRVCADGIALADRRPLREQPSFRLAIDRPGHAQTAVWHREPGKGWVEA